MEKAPPLSPYPWMEYSQLAWIWLGCCCCYWQIITVISSSISMTTEQTRACEMRLKTPEERRLNGPWGKIFCMKGPQSQFCLNVCTSTKKIIIIVRTFMKFHEYIKAKKPPSKKQHVIKVKSGPQQQQQHQQNIPVIHNAHHFSCISSLTIIIMGDDIPNAVCNDNNRFLTGTKNNRRRKTQREKKLAEKERRMEQMDR